MTYEEAGGIATLFTSILVLFTLWEMKMQRESIYQPDIVFKSSGYIYMYRERNGDVFLPSLWLEYGVDFNPLFEGNKIITAEDRISDMELEHILENNLLEPIKIPLYNIGSGAAKNIKIKWSCNPKYTINQLLNLNNDKEIWASEKELVWKKRFKDMKMEQTIDYMLPFEQDTSKEINQIYIPNTVQKFINLFLVVFPDNSVNLDELKFVKIPNLSIDITYHDLVYEKHLKRFIVSFTIESWKPNKKFREQKFVVNDIKMKYQINETKN